MIKGLRRFCTGVLGLTVLVLAAAPSWASEGPVKTVRVLFIGNSFTYFNDLPSLFADFAEATYPNLAVITASVAPSGESLKGHWEKGEALRKLRGARWDYVVLQEHGSLPAGVFRLDGATRHERPDPFFDYGERFLKAGVWHRVHGPRLYHTDGMHPSLQGSYLAAVTIAASGG